MIGRVGMVVRGGRGEGKEEEEGQEEEEEKEKGEGQVVKNLASPWSTRLARKW